MFNRISMGSGMSPVDTARRMCKLHTPVTVTVTSSFDAPSCSLKNCTYVHISFPVAVGSQTLQAPIHWMTQLKTGWVTSSTERAVASAFTNLPRYPIPAFAMSLLYLLGAVME
eukprot:scaffold60116_cov38-Attheya_sp.AAC.2